MMNKFSLLALGFLILVVISGSLFFSFSQTDEAQAQAAAVTITSPAAGASLVANRPMTVTWTPAVPGRTVSISMQSLSSGQSYLLADGMPHDGNEIIVLPAVPDGNYQLRIIPADINNWSAAWSGTFSIAGSISPIIEITEPYQYQAMNPGGTVFFKLNTPKSVGSPNSGDYENWRLALIPDNSLWRANLVSPDSVTMTHLFPDPPQITAPEDIYYNGFQTTLTLPVTILPGDYRLAVITNAVGFSGDDWVFSSNGVLRVTAVQVPVPPRIVSSNPPDRAIDARQPSESDGSNPKGWGPNEGVTLTFSDPISGLSATDFSLTTTGGNAPAINVVLATGQDARLILDSPIPPGERTVITHLPSGTSVCLGYLPGDVNANGTSNLMDSTALINHLNNPASPLPDYSTDINRTGGTNAQDQTRLIDLLNGVSAYDPWLGKQLPACPVVPPPGGGGGQIGPPSVGDDMLTGYAWSANTGWIAFGGDNLNRWWSQDYGVKIDNSTNLNGYAWSSNLGWIKFNPAGPYPSGGPNHGAKLEKVGLETVVTGFARACAVFENNCSGVLRPSSDRGNWDGWIKMSDAGWGVKQVGDKLQGFAWGADNFGWIGFCDLVNNRHCVRIVESDKVNLTVATQGQGKVTPAPGSPSGIDCGVGTTDDCSESYPLGVVTKVVLKATKINPTDQIIWTGDCDNGPAIDDATCEVELENVNRSVRVEFEPAAVTNYDLTVVVNGNGAVTSIPAGIDCPGDCTENFPENTSVALTQTPNQGNHFLSWGGACGGLGCTVIMSATRNVIANFEVDVGGQVFPAITASPHPIKIDTHGSNAPATSTPPGTISSANVPDVPICLKSVVSRVNGQSLSQVLNGAIPTCNFNGIAKSCDNSDPNVPPFPALTAGATNNTVKFSITIPDDDHKDVLRTKSPFRATFHVCGNPVPGVPNDVFIDFIYTPRTTCETPPNC